MSQNITEENNNPVIYTEADKPIVAGFVNHFLCGDNQTCYRYGVLICPNEMVVMVYNKRLTDRLTNSIRKALGKSIDPYQLLNDRQPIAKFGIEYDGKLKKYDLNKTDELPRPVDAKNYHDYKKDFYNQNDKTVTTVSKEK